LKDFPYEIAGIGIIEAAKMEGSLFKTMANMSLPGVETAGILRASSAAINTEINAKT
jgi:hypothetical protein